MNTSSPLIAEMKEKQYRDGYVAAQISLGLPTKIRALRLERKWTQGDLAQRAKMAQPRISEIETPGERKLNLDTLQRLASAFDVGLEVDFVPFGKLISRSEGFDPDSFSVQSFEPELAAATEAARLTTESQTGLLTGLTLDLYEKFASAFKEGVETGQLSQLSGKPSVDWHTAVTMPLAAAKLLRYLLSLNIGIYESNNGPIKVPDNVIPPLVPPPSGELDTEQNRAFYALAIKLHNELTGKEQKP